jgi:hypothetical protein
MLPLHLDKAFPKLKADGARKTSESTQQYNCIAWSAERDVHWWWEPVPREPWERWPEGVPDDYSFDSFVILFEKLGYEKCDNHRLESDFEKVALYSDARGFTHVASQLASGAWTSKLGPLEDIEHNSAEALEGASYGQVKQVLRRAIKQNQRQENPNDINQPRKFRSFRYYD